MDNPTEEEIANEVYEMFEPVLKKSPNYKPRKKNEVLHKTKNEEQYEEEVIVKKPTLIFNNKFSQYNKSSKRGKDEIRENEEEYKIVSQLIDIPARKKTYEMCLEAVKQNGSEIRFVPKKFLTPEMCISAIQEIFFINILYTKKV